MRILIHLTALLILGVAATAAAPVPVIPASAPSKIAYWNTQHRGANCFNREVTPAWWAAAKSAGIEFVRLVPDKWPTSQRDFLIGNADHYDSLVAFDFIRLKQVLDQADAAGMRVVLGMLSLPGARWRQNNGDKPDSRLWQNSDYWTQAAKFWRDLAGRLRGHRAIVGYNIINEPTPELSQPGASFGSLGGWGASVENTAADLNAFYRIVTASIRTVDPQTPIFLDAGSWASASAFATLKPVSDDKTLYAFHMYEPFEYTNRKANGGRVCYPGMTGTKADNPATLDMSALWTMLSPVADWQRQHGIPANRIIAEEFGCHRTNCGAALYLSDLIHIFNEQNWHWAFYSFREDTWDGMDYELGDQPLGAAYWTAVQAGKKPPLPRAKNRIWDVIRANLR